MAVTIYDVAERAGVSISTVSNVLNSPGRVNVATRQRVLGVIDELGFVPRSEAYARARRGVGRIGVVAPLTTYPSYEVRLRGVLDALRDQSFELVVYDQASLTVRQQLPGVAAARQPPRRRDRDVAAVRRRRRPSDCSAASCRPCSSSSPGAGSPASTSTTSKAAASPPNTSSPPGTGAAPSSARPGIAPSWRSRPPTASTASAPASPRPASSSPTTTCMRGPYGVDEARAGRRTRSFDLPDPPTGRLRPQRRAAVGVLKAIADRGWRCPDDVAVIGFDDLDFADYLGLTTIAQPLRGIGSRRRRPACSPASTIRRRRPSTSSCHSI